MRRDDDFFLLLDGGQNCGHEIGEALAHACAGLDDHVARPLDGAGDGVGHLKLLIPQLVRRQPASHSAAGSEDRSRIQSRHAVARCSFSGCSGFQAGEKDAWNARQFWPTRPWAGLEAVA